MRIKKKAQNLGLMKSDKPTQTTFFFIHRLNALKDTLHMRKNLCNQLGDSSAHHE